MPSPAPLEQIHHGLRLHGGCGRNFDCVVEGAAAYTGTVEAVKARFRAEDGTGYIGCHVSHTYRTGACLYFTFAARQPEGRELEHYYEYKRLITDAILRLGGTLTHHHAVGIEHRPWINQEVSPAGLQALQALKTSLDPKRVLNPGKLLPEVG